jgi:predicted RNA-binding Zn-ribbon protein involved in translation (DUF1610 family)
MIESQECETCGGDALAVGRIERSVHYRCPACGGRFSLTLTEEAYEQLVEEWS